MSRPGEYQVHLTGDRESLVNRPTLFDRHIASREYSSDDGAQMFLARAVWENLGRTGGRDGLGETFEEFVRDHAVFIALAEGDEDRDPTQPQEAETSEPS